MARRKVTLDDAEILAELLEKQRAQAEQREQSRAVGQTPLPLVFEAALAASRTCFQLDSEGQATLVLQVPASAAAPLSLAMAKGDLNERTFLVRIEL